MIPHLFLIENSSFQRNFLLFTSAKDFCHHSVTSRCLIILVPFLYVVFSFMISVLRLSYCFTKFPFYAFFIEFFFVNKTNYEVSLAWVSKFFLHAWLNGLREAMQEFLGAYFLFAI